MSDNPVKLPDIGFNDALQRIAKFDKENLPDNLKQSSKEKAPPKDGAVKVKQNT